MVQPLPPLESLKRVHIIGVCGTLMGSFAAFLRRRGIEVTGSDQNVYPPMSDVLQAAGVKLFTGYDPKNLTAGELKPQLVIIGNVIQAVNPEARAAIDGGFMYSSLPEALERLMLKKTRNLVVAGTHGKTTTSSMLAFVLSACGQDPSYFIGGVPQDLPHSFHVSSLDAGKPFVLEGDEYDTAFWDKVPKFTHYLPDDVILTSIEFDHADIYADFDAVKRAFDGLVTRVRKGGHMIACVDYPAVADVAEKAEIAKIPVITYGTLENPQTRFTPAKIRMHGEETSFELREHGNPIAQVKLRIPGNHNVLNAIAVWIECRELGIPAEQILDGLARFGGVKRRQETRGEKRGVLVIDDFAHHPTAVRETLRALKSKYEGRRVVAVFEPRSATSRRKVFQKDYVQAFGEGDVTFIATPYDQSRIPAQDQFSSEQLVSDIQRLGKPAFLMPSVDEGVAQVAKFAERGDVIAVLSNGGFGGFIPKLLTQL